MLSSSCFHNMFTFYMSHVIFITESCSLSPFTIYCTFKMVLQYARRKYLGKALEIYFRDILKMTNSPSEINICIKRFKRGIDFKKGYFHFYIYKSVNVEWEFTSILFLHRAYYLLRPDILG